MFNFNKKKILYIIFLIFFSNNAFSEGTTAIIDLNKILNESNSGKKILTNLEKLNKKNLSLIEDKQKNIKNSENEIESQKKLLSKEDLNIKISQYKKQVNEFRVFREKISKEFNQKKNDEIKKFFKEINPIIQKYMKENNIGILVDKKNIYIANQNNDITSSVLKIIN